MSAQNPARRFQHTDDLKIALAELKEESDSGTAAGGQTSIGSMTRRGWRVRLAWWGAAGLAISLLAAFALWLYPARQASRSAPHVTPLTSDPGVALSPSFSPDGNHVAFVWQSSEEGFGKSRSGIYIKMLGGSQPQPLTHGQTDEFSPAWSPDGRFIAFVRVLSPSKSGVFLIPAIGGPERKLAEVYQCFAVAWFPDSKWLVLGAKSSPNEPFFLFLLSVETGEKRKLTSPSQKSFGDWNPSVSPDGRALVFTRVLEENISDLFLLELSEGMVPK
jgi:Tol biopolymer transport system component